MRRHGRGSGKDVGNAQIVLLLAMVGALFLSLLVIRLGHADVLRTRVQQAADAAALATFQPMRRAVIQMAIDYAQGPEVAGYWLADGQGSAERYARRNNGVMRDEPNITGLSGFTAKVKVRSEYCQLIPEDELTERQKRDLRARRNLCTDNSGERGIGRFARATAIAQFQPPSCTYTTVNVGTQDNPHLIVRLICGDTLIADSTGWHIPWGEISRLYKVRLVDKEDPTPYTGEAPHVGGPYTGPVPPIPPGTPEQLKKILQFIKAQLGKPYCWGGTGMACFDCSGLLWRAFASVGLSIARVSFEQWNYPRVPNGQEKAGDFVFFNSGPNSGPNRPGHVGIVVDPEKKLMIEAACTACRPGVRTSSYQRTTLMGFTRPFRTTGT